MNRTIGLRHFLLRAFFTWGAALAIAGMAPQAVAQAGAGDRPIRIIVPYAAGGQTDAMARVLAEALHPLLRRNVIVDNRPGAAGLIGMQNLLAAPPDGDTLLMRDSGFVAAPLLQKSATYDPTRDLVPVATVGRSDMFVMVARDVPVRNMAELVAYAKAQPAGVAFANNGVNSGSQLAAALLASRTGIDIVHVAYKGAAETAVAMMSGGVKFQINVPSDALLPHIRSGAIRLVATAGSAPSAFEPALALVRDTVPGYGFDGFFCLLAAPNVPPGRVGVLAAAVQQALADPAVRDKFARSLVTPYFRSPQELGQDIARQYAFYRSVSVELKLKPE